MQAGTFFEFLTAYNQMLAGLWSFTFQLSEVCFLNHVAVCLSLHEALVFFFPKWSCVAPSLLVPIFQHTCPFENISIISHVRKICVCICILCIIR